MCCLNAVQTEAGTGDRQPDRGAGARRARVPHRPRLPVPGVPAPHPRQARALPAPHAGPGQVQQAGLQAATAESSIGLWEN